MKLEYFLCTPHWLSRLLSRCTFARSSRINTRSLCLLRPVSQLPVLGTERILLLRVELQRPRSGLSNLGRTQLYRGLHGRRCSAGHRGRSLQQVIIELIQLKFSKFVQFIRFESNIYSIRFRVKLLTVCTLVFSIAIILSGAVTEYWQLLILRMIHAAGWVSTIGRFRFRSVRSFTNDNGFTITRLFS